MNRIDQYHYYELLLMLDNFYGLKPEHDIKDFSTLLANTELAWKLSSTKPEDVDEAITRLCSTYLDDMHSGFNSRSWRSDPEASDGLMNVFAKVGYTNANSGKITELFSNARRAAFPDGMPMYQEIGDTAFITFDEFVGRESSCYYHMDEPQADEFMMKFIDMEALQAQMADAIKEGKDPSGLDLGQKEPVDTIRLFYYAYKQITRENSPIKNVVIDLSNNGGGSCSVLPCTSASGTLFQISSNQQLSTVRNGSFYNIDQGIEPDVPLMWPESFYDREALVAYLHTLK